MFDPRTGEVHRPDSPIVRLEPQPAAVLSLLAETPGDLVSHDALRRALWGDAVHVNFQQNLHYAVRQIRRALGDHDRAAPLIETVPRRGYRLLAPVESETDPEACQLVPAAPGRHRWPLWAAVAAAALLATQRFLSLPSGRPRNAAGARPRPHGRGVPC